MTAGPTQEPLDPVRYLTNHSTGKMGYAVARAAAMRGADVTLIHGPTALPPVKFTEDVPITTAQDMYEVCGFSMETRDMVENSAAKLKKKNLDMVVANNLKVSGAGFGVDTNVVTFITPDGTRELPLMSKADVADAILDEILKRRGH